MLTLDILIGALKNPYGFRRVIMSSSGESIGSFYRGNQCTNMILVERNMN